MSPVSISAPTTSHCISQRADFLSITAMKRSFEPHSHDSHHSLCVVSASRLPRTLPLASAAPDMEPLINGLARSLSGAAATSGPIIFTR